MDERTRRLDEEILIAERAAEWLQRSKEADTREKETLFNWLSRSPENSAELLIATSTDIAMRQLFRNKRIDVDRFLAASANVLTVHDHAREQAQPTPRKRWRWFAVAGLGIAAATAAFFLTPTLVGDWLHPGEYRTSVGEQRAIELPDGSAIAINAESSIRVAYSEHGRDVYLSRGQAMFTVAKDRLRPFRVHVISANGEAPSSTVIQALGTKFDVRRHVDRINVAVIEGVVQIQPDKQGKALDTTLADLGELAKISAGQAVSIESSGLITPPAPVNLSDVSAWQQRRLVFTDNTLEEIAAEFQRYNRTPRIHIENDELRTQRLSGVFDADYPDALLKYLASDGSIIVEHDGDDVLIRLRAVPSPTSAPAPLN